VIGTYRFPSERPVILAPTAEKSDYSGIKDKRLTAEDTSQICECTSVTGCTDKCVCRTVNTFCNSKCYCHGKCETNRRPDERNLDGILKVLCIIIIIFLVYNILSHIFLAMLQLGQVPVRIEVDIEKRLARRFSHFERYKGESDRLMKICEEREHLLSAKQSKGSCYVILIYIPFILALLGYIFWRCIRLHSLEYSCAILILL